MSTLYSQRSKNKGRTKGTVKLTLYDKDGNVKMESIQENIITNVGRAHFVDQHLPSPAQNIMSHYGVGTGTSTPVLSDTALQTQLSRVALTSTIKHASDDDIIVYEATFAAGVATGTLTEGGIFNANTAGVMLARSLFSPTVVKGAGDSLRVLHSIEFLPAV